VPNTLGGDASSFMHNLTNMQQTPGADIILNHPHSFENHGSKSDIMFQENLGRKDLSYQDINRQDSLYPKSPE
jgi:hypothetical protein